MKWDKEFREEVKDYFQGTMFEREDVEDFIRPHFNVDPDLAIKRMLAKEAQKFISSWHDHDGVRDCFSYDLNGKSLFGWPLRTRNLEVLKMMKDKLDKQQRGIEKSLAKVQARIWILEHQITLDDVIKRQQSENLEHQPTVLGEAGEYAPTMPSNY